MQRASSEQGDDTAKTNGLVAAIRPHLKDPVVHSAAKRLHEDKRHASVASELAVSETNPANLPSL
jgi:hypothetical protein